MPGRVVPLRLQLVIAIGAMAFGADALLLLVSAQALLLVVLAVVGTANVVTTLLPLPRLLARRALPHLGVPARGAMFHVTALDLLHSRPALRVLPCVRARMALLVVAMANRVLPGLGPLARRALCVITLPDFVLRGLPARGILARGVLVGTSLPTLRAAATGLVIVRFLLRAWLLGAFLAGAIAGVVACAGLGAESQGENRAQRKHQQDPLGGWDVHCRCPFA